MKRLTQNPSTAEKPFQGLSLEHRMSMGLVCKAYQKQSRLAAVKAKCYDCMCYERAEVGRPGKKTAETPATDGQASDYPPLKAADNDSRPQDRPPWSRGSGKA